jgi:predicted DNA-binding transcriptional regulator AlpA
MGENQELLTTAEVALITRAPAATVRYWRYLGTGPNSFRLGKRVVYRRQEVERWLVEREQAATSPAVS